MKLVLSIFLAMSLCSCAARDPQKYRFEGVIDRHCDEDMQRSHWDAKTGEFVIVCKPYGDVPVGTVPPGYQPDVLMPMTQEEFERIVYAPSQPFMDKVYWIRPAALPRYEVPEFRYTGILRPTRVEVEP